MGKEHIFLTGANGFIGSHLLRRLLDADYRVTTLLRSSSNTTRITELLNHPGFTQINGECMETVFIQDTPHVVIHLATCYRKYHTASDIEEMILSNITFPTQIAQLCATYGVRYFINTGTFFEYDFSDSPLIEQSRQKAFNLYASTKQAFGNILKYYTEQYFFSSLTLRLFSPYGPGDNEKFIPAVIRSIEHAMEFTLQAPNQRLSFTYIDDIVDAYMLGLERIALMTKKYDIVNIAPKETHSLIEVIHMLEKISNKKLILSVKDDSDLDIWHSSFGSNYAERLLNWHARTSLKQGLTLTYNAYRNAI
ncbi:MAG: NAD(P)-dependent oxidoreductase [Candidatus Gracilibacteria bacterium]